MGWSRILTAALACFFGYLLCLYEDTEARLQNRIEDWWLSLSYAQGDAVGAHAGFVRTFFGLVSSWLDRFLGKRLLSASTATTSFLLSLSSYGLGQLQSELRTPDRCPVNGDAPTFYLSVRVNLAHAALDCLAPLLLLLVRRLFVSRRRWYLLVGALAVADVGLYPAASRLLRVLPADSAATQARWLALSIGIVCDFAALIAIRAVLRRASTTRSTLAGLGAALIIAGLLFAIGIAPYFAGAPNLRLSDPRTWDLPLTRHTNLMAFSFALAATTNYYTVAAGLVVALAAVGLAVHRALWPFLERPLYVLQRYRIIQQKKLIGGAALGMAVISLPSRWLETLRDIVVNL